MDTIASGSERGSTDGDAPGAGLQVGAIAGNANVATGPGDTGTSSPRARFPRR